ncbi:MAG: hypothetical protein KBA64_01325 [Armatimonadetes bacterium]|jgi:hypothetical protein|nr:hypothetical protein [Armatimonadota bacterium]MDI9600907.1 hypothetical protein [Acidobacteriota bacterium]NLN88743.1 hypothetical protein [candidate division WS1 bacterium]
MKSAVKLSLTALLVLSLVGAAVAAAITVKVNGTTVRNKVAPFTRHNTQFVQIEPVCKAAKVDYKYDKAAGQVTLCYGDKCTAFKIGEGPKDAYLKNGEPTAAYKVLAQKLAGTATYNADAGVISFTIN